MQQERPQSFINLKWEKPSKQFLHSDLTLKPLSTKILISLYGMLVVKIKSEFSGNILWKHYYQNTDGLIFVVDSNDQDRIEDAAEELKKMLAEEELKDCAVLVMANKQDLNGALAPGEVTKRLGMGDLKGRTWLVQGTSATTGQGLKEGLDWMASVLLKKK